MSPRSIPRDTAPEIFGLQFARWAKMTMAERVELIEQLNADVELLAVAGILAERPGLSDVEVRHELARRRFGATLADEAFEHLLV